MSIFSWLKDIFNLISVLNKLVNPTVNIIVDKPIVDSWVMLRIRNRANKTVRVNLEVDLTTVNKFYDGKILKRLQEINDRYKEFFLRAHNGSQQIAVAYTGDLPQSGKGMGLGYAIKLHNNKDVDFSINLVVRAKASNSLFWYKEIYPIVLIGENLEAFQRIPERPI